MAGSPAGDAPILVLTRGLPASGKTTFAREWVTEDRAHRARVNRDDLRAMADDGVFVKDVTEPRIVTARDAAILALLGKGVSVINDDTNLAQRAARDLARLARRAGAVLQVEDLTAVPLEVCVKRDGARTGAAHVGEDVIRDMYRRYLAGQVSPLPWPVIAAPDLGELVAYVARPGTPKAVLVDVDGTVALMAARGPFDWARVAEDRPKRQVIAVAQALRAAGNRLLFVSGRSVVCLSATAVWLHEHVGVYHSLLMRPYGDMRPDAEVKLDIFNDHIRDHFDVTCVIDDRDQVVRLWRSLGLTVLQPAEGNF